MISVKKNVWLLIIGLLFFSCSQEDYIEEYRNDYIDLDIKSLADGSLYENEQLFNLYAEAQRRFFYNITIDESLLKFSGNEKKMNMSKRLLDYFLSSLNEINDKISTGELVLVPIDNSRFELIPPSCLDRLSIKTRQEGGGFTPINLNGSHASIGEGIMNAMRYYNSHGAGNLSQLINLDPAQWNQSTIKSGSFYVNGVWVNYSIQNKNANMNYYGEYNGLCGTNIDYDYGCYSIGIKSCYDHTNMVRLWSSDRATMNGIRQNIGW